MSNINNNLDELNSLVSSITDNDIDTFKNLVSKNPLLLQTAFNDPDNSTKQINAINLIISYGDTDFFEVIKPYLTKEVIDNGVPTSSLVYAINVASNNLEFFNTLSALNPDLTIKDERGNNLLSLLSSATNIPLAFIQKVLDAGVDPLFTRENSRENAFINAAELKRLDVLNLFSTHPSFAKNLTTDHLIHLVKNDLGTELVRLANTFSSVEDLMNDDVLFNQACFNKDPLVIDTIIDKTMFMPGGEQLSQLVYLMCQNYQSEDQDNAAFNIAQYLFNIKVPFDKFKDPDGNNAWRLAIENNNSKVFNLLLDSPSTLNFVDDSQLSPLMYAVQEQNADFVQKIVNKRPYLMHKDINGNTALLKAVLRKDEAIVEILAKQPNAGVNEPNANGDTPLNSAIRYQNIPMVNALIWSGALISLFPYQSLEDNSAFGFDTNNNFTILHEQKDYKTIDNFNALVIRGFNPNQTNEQGDTLLNFFIKEGILQNFQSLVRCNIDVQTVDKNGNTPLFNAFDKEKDDYVISLLNFHSGFDFNHKNNDGDTIYDIAEYSTSQRKVTQLLRSDNELTKEKVSKVLPILTMDGDFYDVPDIAPLIDVNYMDSLNNDLLMMAVLHNNLNNFEFLQIEAGLKPDLKQKNTLDKTLFDLISELPEEDRQNFIDKLSNNNQNKYSNYEKKKILQRFDGDTVDEKGNIKLMQNKYPKI